MSNVAIRAEGIGKQYRIGLQKEQYYTFRDALISAAKAPFRRFQRLRGKSGGDGEMFWALKDVSLEVKQGEVLGIIGRNGAGKSTLLKILCRVSRPTEGFADVYGRVGSLLEVGTGFHPELTGRENIYLSGAVLGMAKSEIHRKFDEIVDFSGIERFLDTPAKHYSSGMYVRLAFAVAAHLEPEILLVDEVLAVGDAEFQKRCLGKMHDVSKGGRTVVFVSHNLQAIRTLCGAAAYLYDGTLRQIGPVNEVVGKYHDDLEKSTLTFPVVTSELIIDSFDIVQEDRKSCSLSGDLSFRISIGFQARRRFSAFRIGVYIKNQFGSTVLRSFTTDWNSQNQIVEEGQYHIELVIPEKLLMSGHYWIMLHASEYGIRDHLCSFNIQHQVTITAPSHFNAGHMDENIDSLIMLSRPWSITRK